MNKATPSESRDNRGETRADLPSYLAVMAQVVCYVARSLARLPGFQSRMVKLMRGVAVSLGYNLISLRPPLQMRGPRFEYQKRLNRFDIPGDSRVLDIGSGSEPFPYATVLADRFLEPTVHRTTTFTAGGKAAVVCDINRLPFRDGAFDYVYCSHLLEHVDDPIAAIAEIVRVGARGYMETPHFMNDALFSWAAGRHKWHVQAIGARLLFFEYSPRLAEGCKSVAWFDAVLGPAYHPLQSMYLDNMDLFNVMFPWEGPFTVGVYYLDGTFRERRYDVASQVGR